MLPTYRARSNRCSCSLALASAHAPGHVALEIKDLATGYVTAVNAGANMPAASVIKIPVMVEVFEQMSEGRFDLNKTLHLQAATAIGAGAISPTRGRERDTPSRGCCV